ncbi:MAG: hypothetical protein QM831_15020 [Kofleriaceae bacterium]
MRAAVLAIAIAGTARADPLALRADAFASTAAPAGLLVLSADGEANGLLSAEALVWTGDTGARSGDRADGDVLVIALHARTRDHRASGTIGRFVATLGALRVVQLDGVDGRVRLPHAFELEAYVGIPVEPNLATARTWDWVTGARFSRRFGDWGSAGVAYMQQRDDGMLATEELGLDAAAIGERSDVAAKLAYDLANPGLAQVTATASSRRGAIRGELYATYMAASHLLPATSLFTVLGDVPALRVGSTWTWRAAPRLDVTADFAMRRSDGDAIDGATPASSGGERGEVIDPAIAVRATLRLDDRGRGTLGGELRRDGGGDAGWTGARATLRVPLPEAFVASSELELVIPDRDRGLGRVWPWGLVALSRAWGPWKAAVAVEAQASPEDRSRVDVLAQLGRAWSVR